jgi:toxin ParE1/3/4
MEIVWRTSALNDLEALREFITQDNPQAAARVVGAILSGIDRLGRHPGLGRAGRVEGTRELIIANTPYIVAYRVLGQQIRVLAIIHTARRWPRRF